MYRQTPQERLEQTERNIVEAKRQITRLRQMISELQRQGNELRMAMNLLSQFEHRLTTYIGERDRLRKELGLPACPP